MFHLDKEVFLIYARGNVNGKLVKDLFGQSENNTYLNKLNCSITSNIYQNSVSFFVYFVGGILNKHTHRSWSADKVDVCKLVAALKSETADTKLLKAHGKKCLS